MSLLRPALLTGSDLKLPTGYTRTDTGIITPTGTLVPSKVVGGTGWGDGVTFMNRTPSSQIQLSGVSGTPSNYYEICGYEFENIPYGFDGTNDHVCILLTNCSYIRICHCDFQTVGQPIAVLGGDHIIVEWCRANDITGPSERHDVQTGNFIQTVSGPDTVLVRDNKIIGGDTEDIISFFSAANSGASRNQIQGAKSGITDDGWTSASGTGIILGDGGGSDCFAEDNILLDPGQVGIAVAGGVNMRVEGNLIKQLTQEPRATSNVGVYSTNYYGQPFGGHRFIDNRVRFWSDNGGGGWNGSWLNSGVVENVGNDYSDASLESLDMTVTL